MGVGGKNHRFWPKGEILESLFIFLSLSFLLGKIQLPPQREPILMYNLYKNKSRLDAMQECMRTAGGVF